MTRRRGGQDFNFVDNSKTLAWKQLQQQQQQPFNGPLSSTIPWVSTRKVSPIWIILKQETVSDSHITWTTMQICTMLQRDKHARSPPLSFFTGNQVLLLPMNQQCQSTEGNSWKITINELKHSAYSITVYKWQSLYTNSPKLNWRNGLHEVNTIVRLHSLKNWH